MVGQLGLASSPYIILGIVAGLVALAWLGLAWLSIG